MIKVLHFSSELDGGGVERLLYDYYVRVHRENIHFDFVKIRNDRIGMLEKSFIGMGSVIYQVTPMRKNLFSNTKDWYKIISENKYDIIHCHSGWQSFIVMIIAKYCGVSVRIAHSHIAYVDESLLQSFIRTILTNLTKIFSNALFACSIEAGKWMWGGDSSFICMRNAIDLSKFKYNSLQRMKLRNKLHLNDKMVIGCVGRLTYQKNYSFLLKIMSEVSKYRKDCVLVIIGNGELECEIKREIAQLKIEQFVIMLGVQDNVNEWLNVFDIFVLPSRFEGFGLVYLEAQANGLVCLGSESFVPRDVAVTNLMNFLPINNPQLWIDYICSYSYHGRKNFVAEIRDAGFDIDIEAVNLINHYKQLLKKDSI